MSKTRVLIVDDSALVRKVMSLMLSQDPDIDVVATAKDPYDARDKLVQYKPDVITLDIEMPKMDGITFLKKFMRVMPTPTIVVSSLAEQGKRISLEALEAGAVEIITKPKMGLEKFFEKNSEELCTRIKAVARAKVSKRVDTPEKNITVDAKEYTELEETTDKLIAIGASTGGVEALARILPAFPPASPGIVIVQHMPEGFTTAFAERLNSLCAINVREAADGDRVLPGQCLLAPGGQKHMEIHRVGGQYKTRLVAGEKVSFSRPSVDILFLSIAKHVGKNCAAILMTGMGKDGAKGLKSIKQVGAKTFIQDEATSVVFGMPGEAKAIGAADVQLRLDDIPKRLLQVVCY